MLEEFVTEDWGIHDSDYSTVQVQEPPRTLGLCLTSGNGLTHSSYGSFYSQHVLHVYDVCSMFNVPKELFAESWVCLNEPVLIIIQEFLTRADYEECADYLSLLCLRQV